MAPPPPAYLPPGSPYAPSRAMAGWAFGLSLLPCGLTAVVAFVLGLVALSGVRRGTAGGKGLAVAAVVISVAWFLVVVAVVVLTVVSGAERGPDGRLTRSGSISVFDLREGDCLDLPARLDRLQTLTAVPCGEPHQAEVYAVYDLAGGPWPGVREVVRTSRAGCVERFETFVGLSYRRSELLATNLYPIRSGWEAGDDYGVSCLVYQRGREPLTGSLAGAAR